jgi:uncharacterized protein YndB with AHSA1/START domain
MTKTGDNPVVRVSYRFDASAERVYDAFLDPEKASKFMFTTPTGEIVRCEIDARVGGAYTIVDRRNGEDVEHTGEYIELERPRRIVFTLRVAKYSSDSSRVTIEIAPLSRGCELTLTQEMKPEYASMKKRVQAGWTDIFEVAAELLVDEAPTCGIGVARHAVIPAKIGVMFEGLSETLELHRKMLLTSDPNSRKEDEVYRELAASFRDIAERVQRAAARMAAQRDLAMGDHDESAWGADHLRAFEKFVGAQGRLLALLRPAAVHGEAMLASMKPEQSAE